MPYIDRTDGKISGGFIHQQYEGQEFIEEDSEEYQLFLNPPKTVDELRQAAYPPKDELIVALWEKVVEGRPESADALQIERLKVKENIPKE